MVLGLLEHLREVSGGRHGEVFDFDPDTEEFFLAAQE